MKYYKDSDGEIYALELDGSQDHLITAEMKKLTKTEVERIENPDKFLSQAEKYEKYLRSLPYLTRRQFMLMLIENELDDDVEAVIGGIEDIKQRKKLYVEYRDGQSFRRLGDAVVQIFELLGLAEVRINEMWEEAAQL